MSTAARVVARLDQLAKLGRAGHVGALADVDEQAARIDGERLQAAQAAGRRDAAARRAARMPATASADGADMLRGGAAAAAHHVEEAAGGELAQDLGRLLAASRRIRRRRSAARHSDRRTRRCRRCARAPRCRDAIACRRARNSAPPRRAARGGWNSRTPSVVWPDKVRPEASVIVPETMMGSSTPISSSTSRTANSAALAFKVSKMVSIRMISTPPSISARAASRIAAASSSKLMLRNPGSFTSGDSEAVRLVGPSAPATKRCRPVARRHLVRRPAAPGARPRDSARRPATACRSPPARPRWN